MCDGLVRHRDFRSLPSDTTIWSGVSQLVECQMNEWMDPTINEHLIYKALFMQKEVAQSALHNKKTTNK